MRKLAGQGLDDHTGDDPDHPPAAWAVAITDDCDACEDGRVEIVFEEVGRAGTGVVAHLTPAGVRDLGAALTRALAELGEA